MVFTFQYTFSVSTQYRLLAMLFTVGELSVSNYVAVSINN